MIEHTIVRSYTASPGRPSLQLPETVSGDQERNVQVAIAAGTTNVLINWFCTRSKLRSFAISADRAADLYTNAGSGGAYQEHIHLVAGGVYIWTLQTDEIARCPFAGDITGGLYFTPPGTGADLNVSIAAILIN